MQQTGSQVDGLMAVLLNAPTVGNK